MFRVYNIHTLNLVGTVSGTSTVEQEINLNVIPNFGGTRDDYESISTNEIDFHLESIEGRVVVVVNKEIPLFNRPSIEEQVAANSAAIAVLMGV